MNGAIHTTYFDDVVVGEEVCSAARTVTEADVMRYCQLAGDYDPTATDDEFARATEFGNRIAPYVMVLTFSSGLSWRIPRPPLAIMAFMGLEWEFFKPVRIGETVYCRLKSTAKRKMKEGGVVIQEHSILNQHNELVQRGKVTFLVASRPPA
jgi:acyl dehydratase